MFSIIANNVGPEVHGISICIIKKQKKRLTTEFTKNRAFLMKNIILSCNFRKVNCKIFMVNKLFITNNNTAHIA